MVTIDGLKFGRDVGLKGPDKGTLGKLVGTIEGMMPGRNVGS